MMSLYVQGSEADVVILSCVRSNLGRQVGFREHPHQTIVHSILSMTGPSLMAFIVIHSGTL